jgi:hypothetical protein
MTFTEMWRVVASTLSGPRDGPMAHIVAQDSDNAMIGLWDDGGTQTPHLTSQTHDFHGLSRLVGLEVLNPVTRDGAGEG